MANKAEEKEIKLEIGLPQGGFPKSMYFNRFRVDRDAGFCLIQFGLVVALDLVDSYSCVLSEDVLKQNEKTLVEYLNRLGRPTESGTTQWKGVTANRQADVADVITMAYRGNTAETCLYGFSLTTATRIRKGTPTETAIMAQPLVLLRCATDMQKQLIAALYEE